MKVRKTKGFVGIPKRGIHIPKTAYSRKSRKYNNLHKERYDKLTNILSV